jgi:hypothetical protein
LFANIRKAEKPGMGSGAQRDISLKFFHIILTGNEIKLQCGNKYNFYN